MIKEKFDLNNKVAVITGSSKGIGKAMAQGLAEFGATVIVSSRKQEAVDEVAKEAKTVGYELLCAISSSIRVPMEYANGKK